MNELIIPIIVLGFWTVFAWIYVRRFKHGQLNGSGNNKPFWNNQYIFDNLPSVFPTLGILCTALGITIGIWNFKTDDIQQSISQLLGGLKLAFVATMLGIIGLVIFQKIIAIVQKSIDDSPLRPKRPTDELSALETLNFTVNNLQNKTENGFLSLINSSKEEGNKLNSQVIKLQYELNCLQLLSQETNNKLLSLQTSLTTSTESNTSENKGILSELTNIKDQQATTGKKANDNTHEIIVAMGASNKLITYKFDEFAELLAQNNTQALVEVMKSATEQFNSQMSELINKLVQENFKELNTSVKSLNDWQQENKNQILKLTQQFTTVSDELQFSAETLNKVAQNTKALTDDNGKLAELVFTLQKLLINDTKFSEMAEKIDKSVKSLNVATADFEDFADKVNKWATGQTNMNNTMIEVVAQLKDFKDFNGNVWNNYRNEMNKSVEIVRNASQMLSRDIDKINENFILMLNDTLSNLDTSIQTFMTERI